MLIRAQEMHAMWKTVLRCEPVYPVRPQSEERLPLAWHLLRPDQHALDLRVVDAGIIAAAGEVIL